MRRFVAILSVLASFVAGPVGAEPPKPAAGGTPDKIPFDVPYGAPITLDRARKLLAAVEAEAAKRGWTFNLAVVDPHGDLVAFARMDGAQLASVAIAQRKARIAARFRRETRVFFNALMAGQSHVATLDPDMVASPGGIPLVEAGRLIGAIGCSGGTGDQDALVCQKGVDALE